MEKDKEVKKIINVDLGNGEGDAEDAQSSSNNSESVNTTEAINGNAETKKNKKMSKALKDILTLNNSTKFMSNFDPELSNREKRKLTRKLIGDGKKNGGAHDESGASNSLDKDVCDCLLENCPGCHFPCPKCRSCKCGVDCRLNRKWTYDAVENEAETAAAKAILAPS